MKLILAMLCALPAVACVSLPTPQEMLDTGFRTPEMTFHTFQMGVRADLPTLEFLCLSAVLQGEGGQLGYRELRDDLKGEIAYWLGIPDAKVTGSVSLGPDRHLLQAESHGHHFEVEFVREYFWEVWTGDEFIDDSIAREDLGNHLLFYRAEDGELILAAEAGLPDSYSAGKSMRELAGGLTEFRVGCDWKIAGFRESAPAPPAE